MIRTYTRASLCSNLRPISSRRAFHATRKLCNDPRLQDLGRVIKDEYAVLRDNYDAPKHTIILAHGLLGFDELRLGGSYLPGIHYWRGITEALSQKGVEVIVAAVPPSGSIEARAKKLAESIGVKAKGKDVNIIAHSMVPHFFHSDGMLSTNVHAGVTLLSLPNSTPILSIPSGLDSRYMISQIKPTDFNVLSLTTVASPHRGSAFADYMFASIGPGNIKRIYKVMETFGFETGAFSQLTRDYMAEDFNPKTPDVDGVRYYSYGASLEPSSWSVFAASHSIIKRTEGGPNDGLVSVSSSQWGDYKGTLIGVSHLDLINWTNRLKWFFWELTGSKRSFNAIAFYLDIADMLAKEGL